MNTAPPLPPLPPNVVNLPHITRPEPINDGGPTFPVNPHPNIHGGSDGMTIRQYAAIKLRVPDSGTDWLDEMIRKSNRDYFAAAALQGSIACVGSGGDWNDFAKDAYKYADAMLKAREVAR